MNPMPRFSWWTLLALMLVIGCAGGARGWYVSICTDNGVYESALIVQGPAPRLDNLVANLVENQTFDCVAPLADGEKPTAHIAPGYSIVFSLFAYFNSESAETMMRWLQCALGTLTAGAYFFFARRAFHSTLIATLAGLFCAFHPFWVINTAELNDGVLVSFLVGLSLMLGARGSQEGGAFTGLCFGLALAAVALTRAGLLPFTVVALLGYLWQCRRFPLGWLAAFLALIAFANGLAPWGIRNYLEFERPIPMVSSTYLHLWIGNNPRATGSTLDETALRATLTDDRLKTLLDEPNQAKRYNQLSAEVWQEIQDHPTETLIRRINAALRFLLGERWFENQEHRLGWLRDKSDTITEPPSWITEHAETILHATLLGMFILGLIGWRWSYAWRRYDSFGAIAFLCIPLPYLLGHAEYLAGPRLPLDGVLLCYSAFALASVIPWLVVNPKAAAKAKQDA